MIRTICHLLCLIALVGSMSLAQEEQKQQQQQRRQQHLQSLRRRDIIDYDTYCLYCQIEEADVTYDDDDEESDYYCVLDSYDEHDGELFAINLPESFVDEFMENILDGDVFCIANGQIIGDDEIYIPHIDDVFVDPSFYRKNRERKLIKRVGVSDVLIARISTAQGVATRASAAQLSQYAFCTDNPDATCMAKQYNQCSNGKLELVPAEIGNNVTNGVIEVTLQEDYDFRTLSTNEMQRIVMRETQAAVGSYLLRYYGHVMFCLPPGVLLNGKNWIAYAFRPGTISFYNDNRCESLSVTMHEIGHNIGFSHSGENRKKYGDTTGMMGSSYGAIGRPHMCFNGQKYFSSGWLTPHQAVEYQKTNLPVLVPLVAFVDMGSGDQTDVIAIRVERNFFLYNRRRGFNRGTRERYDQVTVTSSSSVWAQSSALDAQLTNDGDMFDALDGITIQICNYVNGGTVDYALVSIYETGDLSLCPEGEQPSSSPSQVPSVIPSSRRTALPSTSALPSDAPSLLPSQLPTPIRSAAPSVAPSITASPSISNLPSDAPSLLPSFYPSSVPSFVPSNDPSSIPSNGPSQGPSTYPSAPPSLVPTVTPSSGPTNSPSGAPTPLTADDASRAEDQIVVPLITCSTFTDKKDCKKELDKTCFWEDDVCHRKKCEDYKKDQDCERDETCIWLPSDVKKKSGICYTK